MPAFSATAAATTIRGKNMRILFVTAHPYLPQLHGGMQSSADELSIHLKRRGHWVAVLAGLTPDGPVGWKSRIKMQINQRLCGCKVSRDSVSDYPVWRTWFSWDALDYVAEKERGDLSLSWQVRRYAWLWRRSARKFPSSCSCRMCRFTSTAGASRTWATLPASPTPGSLRTSTAPPLASTRA